MTRSNAPAPPQERRGDTPPDSRGARFATFTGQSFDEATRTIEIVLSVGARVQRWGWQEELEISSTAADLGRVAMGQVRFLDHHNQWSMNAVLGVVEDVRIVNGQLTGRVRLGESEAATTAAGMIARGELTGISIGYGVRKWQLVELTADEQNVWRAVDWELFEVSLVSVPADPNAGVRSVANVPGSTATTPAAEGGSQEDSDMRRSLMTSAAAGVLAATLAPENDAGAAASVETRTATPPVTSAAEPEARAAPATPPVQSVTRFTASEALDFVEQARAFGDAALTRAGELVRQNEAGSVSVETARSTLLQVAAEGQRAATSPVAAGAGARAGDSQADSREAIIEALTARALRQAPTDRGRQYMGLRMLELARERANLNPRERDPVTILRAAHTTSDFPVILEAVANRVLLAAYGTAAPTYQAIARRRDLTDFKATKLLRIGDFPTLLPYAEDGEIKAGTINEGRESVTLGSFGRIIRLSRQAIVNDDLGAFDEVIGSIGRVVARFENATFYAMKAQNGGAGPKLADGKNLFHADHGNLAGAGAAPDITTLGAARAAIRKQKDIDGNAMSLAPRVALVGPDLETTMDQLTASIQPVVAGSVNPFSGKLTVVTEGAIAGNAWELYADPADCPVFSYGYLADSPGPRLLMEETFNVDGLAWRVTLDFYAGATDYRGAFRNPGA